MSDEPEFRWRGGSPRTLFGGRTIEVRVYVNTDEGVENVAERIVEAAKGPRKRMVLASAGEVPKEQAEGLWAAARQTVEPGS